VTQEVIDQGFVDAGWKFDGSFSGHLIVGEDEDLTILAHRWVRGIDDPVFELGDGDVTYWVQDIPRPREARELLKVRGGLPEEERGNPYKQAE
jgi:hypothetical protein